jgi:hypothetical protein
MTTQPPASTTSAAQEEAAAQLIANFETLWSTKDPEIVREIVAPDAEARWSGVGAFRGTAYPERMRVTMEEVIPDVELRVTGSAVRGSLVFIRARREQGHLRRYPRDPAAARVRTRHRLIRRGALPRAGDAVGSC